MEKTLRIEMPEAAEEIIARLKRRGYEAFAVGGCVRDSIMGRKPEDWDITTSALPQQVKEVFRRTIDTGIQHGTVTVMKGGIGYEVTTYRIDGEYRDGRHPSSVSFTENLKEDLRRRDFTINAMAYSHETGLVDEFGGLEDMAARRIRCVGDPMERFTEDALRILRAIRFSAQLDFAIEEKTLEAISLIAPNLAKVSRERVQTELTKLLLSPHPEKIRQVYETGISPYVSPAFHRLCMDESRQLRPGEPHDLGLDESRQLRPGEPHDLGLDESRRLRPGEPHDLGLDESRRLRPGESHHLRLDGIRINGRLPKKKHVRWAVFLKDASAAEAVEVLRDLKLDNDTINRVRTLNPWINCPVEPAQTKLRQVMSLMEPELFDDLLDIWEVLEADKTREDEAQEDETREDGTRKNMVCGSAGDLRGETQDSGSKNRETQIKGRGISAERREAVRRIRQRGDCVSLKELAVSGRDLMAAGMKPGKAVGETLQYLLSQVLEEPEKNKKDVLLALAAEREKNCNGI